MCRHCDSCKSKKSKGCSCNFFFDAVGDHNYDETARNFNRILIDEVINVEKPKFVVHAGDIAGPDPAGFAVVAQGWLPTAITAAQQLPSRTFWWTLNSPFFVTPGDNDWSDTIRAPGGPLPPGPAPYPPNPNPLATLADFRDVFYNQGMNVQPCFTVVSQPDEQLKYSEFVENKRWVYRNIVFVTVHTVSGNNGLNPSASPFPSAMKDVKNETATAIFVGSIAGNTLTVTSMDPDSLPIAVGQDLTSHYNAGNGVRFLTTITAFGTGTGGVGTYTVSGAPQVVNSTDMFAGGRINANLSWLSRAYDVADQIKARGLVIITQANMGLQTNTITTGFTAMASMMRDRTLAKTPEELQVLLIRGDAHLYVIQKPLPNQGTFPPLNVATPSTYFLSNFTEVGVPGGNVMATNPPIAGSNRLGGVGRVKISVDFCTIGLFNFYNSLDTL